MSVTLGVTTWSLTMSLDYCTSKRKEGECTESPDLEELNLPITRQHRKPIYEKRSYEKHCFLLSSPYPEPIRWPGSRDGTCSFTSTWSGERKAAGTKG